MKAKRVEWALCVVSKEMHLLFKGNSEIRKRPDLGCQVSIAKSMLQWLRTDGVKKPRSQKWVRAGCSLSFEFSRCHADERHLNDRADRGKGSAQQRCHHQGCQYQPRAAARTQMQGWRSSSDSIIPSVLGRVCQKVVSCHTLEMWPLAMFCVSPFPLPHLVYLLYLDTQTKANTHSVCTLPTAEGFLSHLVTSGSAEVQWGGAGTRLEMPVCLPNCHPRCFQMRMSAEITLRLGITRQNYSLTSIAD